MIRVTVWNEFRHEREIDKVKEVYPEGIHKQIASFLACDDIKVRTAEMDEQENGLPQEIIDDTDVLIWWGHCYHHLVSDEVAERIHEAVLKGMGFIALHSAHKSKPFMRLMGTSCNLIWREGDRERLWCCNPTHPLAKGLPMRFELPNEEMYGEFFDIPQPDDIVFIGWFKGGEVFRSVCTFDRGYGRVVYIQPGHEEYPTFYNENIQTLVRNAVEFTAPRVRIEKLDCPNPEALEK